MKTLLALVPNQTGWSPGQRVRIETWARHLPVHGWAVEFMPFEDKGLHDVLYKPGNRRGKALALAKAWVAECRELARGTDADAVFVYREAALIGPEVFERMATRGGKALIVDLDDPVWLPWTSPNNGAFTKLKFIGKTQRLVARADRVTAINDRIGGWCARHNPRTTVLPNCVDTSALVPGATDGPLKLVWSGSQSTLPNLLAVSGAVKRLQARHTLPFRVVSSGTIDLPGLDVEWRTWTAKTELTDLQGDHIGLVPLPRNDWNGWKFYLKLVQYLAVGLPIVAERLGSNEEVIEDGVNGFLASSEDEWVEKIERLIADPALRRRLGANARKTAEDRYAIHRQIPEVAALLDEAVEHARRRSR